MTIRIAALQMPQQSHANVDDFLRLMTGYIQGAAAYAPNFLVLPEHLSFGLAGGKTEIEPALRHVATFFEDIVAKQAALARVLNLYLIGGSMPRRHGTEIRNTTPIVAPDGTVTYYDKLHLTPWEQSAGFSQGERWGLFDTQWGKMGVAICYDVEFPEYIRHLGLHDIRALFVPFQTDNRSGYWRVRHCAQARAIENECYVALAGNAGTLSDNPLMDFNHSISAILTPSDHLFPESGILRESVPNAADLVVADVDLDALDVLNESGSVQIKQDRRTDLYHLQAFTV